MLAAIDFRQASVLAETNTVARVGGKKHMLHGQGLTGHLQGPDFFVICFLKPHYGPLGVKNF